MAASLVCVVAIGALAQLGSSAMGLKKIVFGVFKTCSIFFVKFQFGTKSYLFLIPTDGL